MGISSRDYYRNETGHSPGWMSGHGATRGLIVITFAVFVAQVLFGDPTGSAPSLVDLWCALDPSDVAHGQVWRVVTYAFLHDRYDLLHLVLNMLTLWFFGRAVEQLYGSRELVWFYIAAATVCGVGFTAWGWAFGLHHSVVGASGAVMAVLMLFARHYPHEKVSIMGLISIEAQWLVVVFAIFDLYPVLSALGGGVRTRDDRVAHIVHLAGLAFGWLYFQQGWRLSSGWNRIAGGLSLRLRRLTAGRRLKVYQPEPEEEPIDLEAEVDRILAKIHEHGTESLTAREQSIMEQASRRYKRK